MKKNFLHISIILILSLACFCFGYVKTDEVYAVEEDIPANYCLRDDYLIYTENQAPQGLCWDFASSISLTTTIEMATNEYINFSEGWISTAMAYDSKTYLPGGGATFDQFYELINKHGLVLEHNFTYPDFYNVTRENALEYYNHFKSFSNKEITKNIKTVSFNKYFDVSDDDKQIYINNIKTHIKNSGAVVLDLWWGTTGDITADYYVNRNDHNIIILDPRDTSKKDLHEMAVIGWDDNLSWTNGSSVWKGAWICLNSNGTKEVNDGVYYVFYEDSNHIITFKGFEYNENKDDMYFNYKISSNADITVNNKGKYYYPFTKSETQTKQKNIFDYGEDINLVYNYDLSIGSTVKSVEVYDQYEKEITSSLKKLTNDTQNKVINLQATNLASGSYKVIINYGDNVETKSVLTVFYVKNNLELSFVKCSYELSDDELVTTNQVMLSANNCDKNLNNSLFAFTEKTGKIKIEFNVSTYSEIDSVTTSNSELAITLNNQKNFFELIINFDFGEENQKIYSVKLNSSSGLSKNINFILKKIDNQSNWVKTIYNLNGGWLDDYKNFDVSNLNTPSVLSTPQREGYNFLGWSFTSNMNSDTIVRHEYDKFYLDNSQLYSYSSANSYIAVNNTDLKTGFFTAIWQKASDNISYYTITSLVNGNGQLMEEGILYVPANGSKTLNIIPADGYELSSIYVDDISLSQSELEIVKLNNSYAISNVNKNYKIKIVFAEKLEQLINYKINYFVQIKNENSENYYNGNYYKLYTQKTLQGKKGEQSKADIITIEGYIPQEFKQITLDSSSDNVINIYYDIMTFYLEKNYIYDGEIIKQEILILDYGDQYFVNFEEIKGYDANRLELDNQVLSQFYYQIYNMKQNYVFNLHLDKKFYHITINITGAGEVACKGSLTDIQHGSYKILYFIPENGSYCSSVFVNGKKVTLDNNRLKIYNIEDNINIKAVFEDSSTDLAGISENIIQYSIVFVTALTCIGLLYCYIKKKNI